MTEDEHYRERQREYRRKYSFQDRMLKLVREGFDTMILAQCYRRSEDEIFTAIHKAREREHKRLNGKEI